MGLRFIVDNVSFLKILVINFEMGFIVRVCFKKERRKMDSIRKYI